MTTYQIKRFEDYAVGDSSRFTKTVSEADVSLFAELSGDDNPLHVDSDYARQTRFGGRLVHGALAMAYVSAALTRLGLGHVYVAQQTRFRRPVFVGDTLTATAEIAEKLSDKQRLRVRTACINQHGDIVNEGEALLQCLPELFGSLPSRA